jgi:hypothetical protein
MIKAFNNRNKSIFILGFDDSQLLILFSILNRRSQKYSYKKIIFGQNISKRLLKTKIVRDFFKNKEIVIFKKNFSIKNYLSIIFFIILSFHKILIILFTLNRKKLLDKKLSWFNCQLYHSVWDLCYLKQREDKLIPDFFSKFYNILIIYVNLYYAKIIKSLNVEIAFMGHLVYAPKAIIAEFRESNIKIFGHTMESYFPIDKEEDTMWSILTKDFFKKINLKIINKKISLYWNKRLKGKGNNEDSRVAAQTNNVNLTKNNVNIIMLHIFKDSPFNFIDRNRIFADYYEWIEKTLEILTESNELWIVRLHPNAKRWGENSELIFNKIYENVKKKLGKKPNTVLDLGKYSNIELFKNANKIVTFSGTSHLESVCFGIKPIVISHVTLSKFDKDMVIKPKNILEYKKFLLSSDKKIFKIADKSKIYLAKKILFVVENILTFQKDIGFKTVYRADSKKKLDKLFKIAVFNAENKIDKFKKISQLLDSKLRRTLSWKYLKCYKI